MKKSQWGFTLVELLLATAFFGFILIIVTAGFMQVSRSYNKGITVKRVQETTRQVVDELSRTILSATNSSIQTSEVSGKRRLCVGNTRFAWNQSVGSAEVYADGGNFRLARDGGGNNCEQSLVSSNSVELIDERLAVQDITITPISAVGGIYQLCVIMSTNKSDDLTVDTGATNPGCELEASCNIMNGDQFCDVAQIKTIVTLRR